MGMRGGDVSGAGWEAVSGKRRYDRAQATLEQRGTYNSLSVLGMREVDGGDCEERGEAGSKGGIEVIKGFLSCLLAVRSDADALSAMTECSAEAAFE
jgi:hypothetical protein